MGKRPKIPDLYYYTTVETMRFILQQANIYATNLKYMNDSEEFVNGLFELREVINTEYKKDNVEIKKMEAINLPELISEDRLRKSIEAGSDSYSISFSTERDLLSQWSMYARESGVSLLLDFNRKLDYKAYTAEDGGAVRELITKNEMYPRKVYYFTKSSMPQKKYEKVKKEIILEIEKNSDKISIEDIEGNAVQIWKDMTPYVKRYEFQAEGEYRLVFNLMKLPKRLRIDYRNDKHVLKPYLDVECDGGWPIKEIIIGPGFNQQVVYESLIHFLDNARLKTPSLSGSEFAGRCTDYLTGRNGMPQEVQILWSRMGDRLHNEDEMKRFYEFEQLVEEILKQKEIDQSYKKFIKNRYLSKCGILLSKSEIPYIF